MDVLVLIDKLDDLMHNARAVPLTDQVRIDREEIWEILDQMRATIPEEIKQARWIVKERQEMLAEAKREAERIVSEAREQGRAGGLPAGGRQAGRAPGGGASSRRRASASARSGSAPRTTPTRCSRTLEVNLGKFLAAVQRGREQLSGPRSQDRPTRRPGSSREITTG